MNLTAGARPDEWLNQVLARPSWGVVFFEGERPPGLEDLGACQGRAGAFVYAKAPADDLAKIHWLEEAGFRLIETSLTLEKPLSAGRTPPAPADGRVRPAAPSDQAAVRKLAGNSFIWSRFHLDPAFAPGAADRLKAEWAGNYFLGRRGQAMIVAEVEGRVAGFLQLLFDATRLVIDLVAVSSDHRRQGLAAAMIGLAEAGRPRFETIRVGTQAVNTASLRLYEGLGFKVTGASQVLHFHHQ